MERSLELFLASIKTEATKTTYMVYLNKFKESTGCNNFDDIISLDSLKIQRLVEDYVLDLRKNSHPNSIRTKYFPVQSFLEMNDIMINFKKMRRLFPETVKTQVERGWTIEEIKRMLDVSDSLRTTAVIHFENATGGRIGIFNGLKIKHLKEINDSKYGKCYAIVGYSGSKEEYITFLTPEATKHLDNYLASRGKVSPESNIFTKLNGEDTDSNNISKSIWYLQKKAGLRNKEDKKENRFAVPSNHGFRHRFNEIIKSSNLINPHTAERLLSHTSKLIPLDTTYFKPDLDSLFNEYRKIIPLISIDQSEVLRLENQSMKVERVEYESMKKRLEELEKYHFIDQFTQKV